MHLDKIVTVFFSKRMPQYAFRQLYCHHQGFLSKLLHRPILELRHNSDSLLWRNSRIGLCNILLKKTPDDGNIIAEMRIGAFF
jgi:hypothetical protein